MKQLLLATLALAVLILPEPLVAATTHVNPDERTRGAINSAADGETGVGGSQPNSRRPSTEPSDIPLQPQAPSPQLVLADPPPLPSGASGKDGGPRGEPRWIELKAVVAGPKLPQLRRSDPGGAVETLTAQTPPPRISFNGVIGSPVTSVPPDTHIAVGPGLGVDGRVIMVTNGHVQIWNKTGTTIAGPTLLDTVFGTNCYDPKVLYDQHSGRFFMVCLEGTSPSFSRIHIAVSSGGTPNNLTTDWTFMSGSAVTSVGGISTWADYPGIGADNDSLFVTANLFDSGNFFRGTKIRVFDKAALIAGSYTFVDINYNAAVTTGVFTIQPAHVYGITDNGGFYLICRIGPTAYRIFNITGDPAAPVATTSTHAWSAGAFPADWGADQLGTTVDLDTLASRIMNAVYRDGHIWLCLTSDPDGDGQTEAVWQDIATNGGPPAAPTVFQSGFINGTGADPWTYMPSINVNSAGHTAICYTQSSLSQYPDVVYAMRRSADPPGMFHSPAVAKAGPGYYDSFYWGDPDRWGDYSGCVVDPTNDCFWVANEFAWFSSPANSKWGTFIASFCPQDAAEPALIYEFPLDSDPGWTCEGYLGWAFGQPTGGGGAHGGPDPTSGYTGLNVYGYNLNGDYYDDISPTQYLTTTAINCQGYTDVSLRFRRWLGVERSAFDHASIQVSDGGAWVTIWQNPDSAIEESSWSLQGYDISSVADNEETVFIRWGMGPTDSSWTYCGWNIDDIEIWGVRLEITDVYWDQTATSVVVTFNSQAGVQYVLERADADAYADGLSWYTLPGDTLTGTAADDSFTDDLSTNPLSRDFRFYRVKRADDTRVTWQTVGVFELSLSTPPALKFIGTPLLPDPDHDSVREVFGEGATRQVPRTGFQVSDLNEASGAISRMRYNAGGTFDVIAGSAFDVAAGCGYEVTMGLGPPQTYTLRLTGYVPEEPLRVPMTKVGTQSLRWLAYSMPRAIALNNLGIQTAVTPWSALNRVRLLPPGSSVWQNYEWDGADWAEVGGPGINPTVACGSGIVFIRFGAPDGTDELVLPTWYLDPPNE